MSKGSTVVGSSPEYDGVARSASRASVGVSPAGGGPRPVQHSSMCRTASRCASVGGCKGAGLASEVPAYSSLSALTASVARAARPQRLASR
eukprot:8120419-Lingulodinium_polyedra.AAC.1